MRTDVDATARRPGYAEQMDQVTAGAQLALSSNWRAGFALGYDKSTSSSENFQSSGDRVTAGGVVKYSSGPLLLAASVSGGRGSYDRTREIAFAGFSAVATSSSDVDFFGGRVHAAYLFDFADVYVKPMIDAGVTHMMHHGFVEKGGNGAALAVAGSSTDPWSISPAVELGTQQRFGGLAWRPFVKVGATFIDPSESIVTASFVDAPAASFTTRARYDSVLADVGTGLTILNAEGAALRLQYDAKFGATTEEHSFSVKGSLPF